MNSRFWKFGMKMWISLFSIFSESGRRLNIVSIDFIEHYSVLVLDMVWTEDVIHRLNLQLL